MMLSPDSFIMVYTGVIALIALTVYVALYELFQNAGGRRVSEEAEPIRYYPVMCGWDADYKETPPLSKVITDILQRSWRHLHKPLAEGGKAYMRDWYVWAYIALVALAIAALIVRWS